MSRGVTTNPARRARLTTAIDRMLSPPRAKKSPPPDPGQPSTSAIAAQRRPLGVRAGGAALGRPRPDGGGNAPRSTLAVAVNGRASSSVHVDG